METPEVVIALSNGTKILCTAKSAKYLIIWSWFGISFERWKN